MAGNSMVNQSGEVMIPDPPLAATLFGTTRFSWLWLILRVYLGWQWLSSGWGKISGGTWTTGESLKGFWTNAVAVPESGRPPIAFDWYRDFIQFMLDRGWYTWFADVIMWGEFFIGIALILGAFVGIAAFFGAFLNWNFIMAGTASTNGLLFAISIVLMLAWKVAGWYGLDRFLLPLIGTPWYRGRAPSAAPASP
ncbi:MAG TPA: DoxX family protein [Roseiflexaceae bacterium]|nr:DoxX family protein [Roseiflexaceae bacterium]